MKVSGSIMRKQKKKILIIAGYADSLIKFRGELINALLKSGLEVHTAAPEINKNIGLTRELGEKNVFTHDIFLERTGVNPLVDIKSCWNIYCLMRKIRPDLILAYTIKPVVYGLLAGRFANVPKRYALITGLGYSFQAETGLSGAQKVAQGLYRLALRFAQKVFFQNPDDLELFRTRQLLPSHLPACVLNGSGVDVEKFAFTPLPEDSMCFLLIARLLIDKGLREFAQAATFVKAQYPQARFAVVGWIDSNPRAIRQEELDEWVQAGTLEYWGKLADVRPALEKCTVYVLPSYGEGTPKTVLEAMSMGRPIITTDVPGCRETVVQGLNGYLVPAQSGECLADAMRMFLKDRTLAKHMGAASRKIAEEKYDVHQVNANMLREMELA